MGSRAKKTKLQKIRGVFLEVERASTNTNLPIKLYQVFKRLKATRYVEFIEFILRREDKSAR